MGMSMGAGSSGDDDDFAAGSSMSEINVTPLVDVMLVLLVIFMVTAPLINQAGVDVDLPTAKSGSVKQEQSESAIVTLDKFGNVFIDDRKLTAAEFDSKFKQVILARKPKAVFLRADRNVPYGTVMKVMDELRAAGVTRLGMMTDPRTELPGGTDPK